MTQFNVTPQPAHHFTIDICASEIRAFAESWPCFGTVKPRQRMFATFDASGDLVDLQGDDGLDGAGVAALLDDCLTAVMRRNPAIGGAGHRARLLGDA